MLALGAVGAAWLAGAASGGRHHPHPTPSPGPTPSSPLQVTPVPTMSMSPIVVPGSSWFGLADPWAGIPFGSLADAPAGQYFPAGGDKGGATFGNFKFVNRAAGVNVMVLDGWSNAILDLIDFDTVPECIYMNNCSNITLGRIRARNIYGPFTRTGFHSGNLIQASGCSNIVLQDFKVDQPSPQPGGYTAWGTEDVISLGAPNPAAAWGNWTIRRGFIDGGDWQSSTGTGLFVGDGDLLPGGPFSHDITVEDVILYRPGAVGIGTGEGGPFTFNRIHILGLQRTDSNDSIQLRTNNASFGSMTTDWTNAAGTHQNPNLIGHTYTDLGGNTWLATIDPAAYEAMTL